MYINMEVKCDGYLAKSRATDPKCSKCTSNNLPCFRPDGAGGDLAR